jgi:hypothetical protein
MTLDLAIIGIVFALILLIIFFSAVVLYLSFRIKETFKKETRRGATIAKVGFLIGILFLAGGIFYFFANTLSGITGPTITPVPTITPAPTATPASSSTPTPPSSSLTLAISYPPSAKMSAEITISFTIVNPTGTTVHGATIQANVLFTSFSVQPSSTHQVIGNVVNVGEVPPGTTIVSMDLIAPSRAGIVTDTVSLLCEEILTPITQEIEITIKGAA